MESNFTSDHHAKARCFFKIIVCEINSKSELMIPGKFVRKYGEEIQGRVLLKASGGATWSVNVQRKKGEVWLRNGWPEFAKFYSLCFGHSILFEYQGNCNFRVVIFDTSATEIDYPLQLEKRSGSDEVSVSTKKQVHSGNKACHVGYSLKRKSQEKAVEVLSNMETSSSDEEDYGDIRKSSHANGTQPDTSPIKKRIKLELDLDISMHQHVIRGKLAKGVSSPASIEEKDGALAEAKAFTSSHPFFEVVMQPSYVGKRYGLHVKKDLLKSYIRKGVEVLILRIGAKTWAVKCSVNSKRLSLSLGWHEFAKDNALAVGDVCVFELVRPSQKLINVVIYRAASRGVEQQ
ncbi:hypothetical protein POM88_039428 [Heracleum sosnowskyi]|uniref:TF-B3 domain-containing protein n=1 Tax=Heracleum sosnowskyi TaxID=360622 RepID=A0AAD8HD29_9APIA|nr:hypothetical protein POM88_039428 [Heracleum sosnowskyi]